MTPIEELDNFIIGADRQFLRAMKGVQKLYYDKALEIINNFRRQNGLLQTSLDDTRLYAILQRELEDIFTSPKYRSALSSYIQNFDNVANLTLNTLPLPQGAPILNISVQRQIFVDGIVNTLASRASLNTAFIAPIQKIIYSAVTFGSTFAETQEAIEGLILGNNDKLGMLQRYAGQITRDSLNQFSGSVYNEAIVQYNFTKFRYVNSIIEDSRPNCIDLVNGTGKMAKYIQKDRTYLISDLSKIIADLEDGAGWIEGTNTGNFFINRGGYNCRHKAIPAL
jgi:hypothetical protein